MMRRKSWTQFSVLVAVLALNAFVVLQITGVAYEPFSWKAFAFVYNSDNSCAISPDNDGDCILASRDLDDNFFNPSGCFYDSVSGEIVADRGGVVASANDPMDCDAFGVGQGGGATTAADCHVYIPDNGDPMNGSKGCYSFLLKGSLRSMKGDGSGAADGGSSGPSPIQLAITVPDGCALDTLNDACMMQPGAFTPPDNFNEVSEPLGSPPNAGRTELEGGGFPCDPDGGCECPNNPWYGEIDLGTSTAGDVGTRPLVPVVHNNIPLLCNTPDGGACIEEEPQHCDSGFCAPREESEGAGGVCCDAPCDEPFQVCDLEGQEGTCVTLTAPAPAMSPMGMAALLGALLAIGGLALLRRKPTN